MSDDLTALNARQLLARIEDALGELLKRGIVRSRNAPLGDVAERIVWLARGGTLERNSTKSHDVTTDAGERIQVKARIMKGNGGKFSSFRSFEFTTAIFLSFDPATLDIDYARELRSEEATGNGARSGWTNATTLTGGRVKRLGTDVTEEMRAAYARLDEPIPPG
ncbi:hypothetical protein FQ142_00495 [Microbacterium sp. ANT_H45B]|uniref:hypothetical protein n=1 Tax=Microbacterium sp. ANT_H45B TaxID=2597346 RepID=UPI0011EBD719|nr:hypothetical protein [Microbacterium sp. ANT_H45B]KAA0961865.1 hypothetical protein FQ142_00495 [Microbacterium sp. ANT_H45B]